MSKDIAAQKNLHKSNQDKTYKLELLQRKLRHVQHMIAEGSKQDSGF